MTREEFFKHADQEIEDVFRGRKNRVRNLIEQAWAEGKRNAEVGILKEAIEAAYEEYTAPTLHARWILHNPGTMLDYVVCTNCREISGVRNGLASNYCPNCGAKMDGVDEAEVSE